MAAEQTPEFNDRELHILKLLIAHYIEQGQPVGSRTLSRLPGMDISAASVRNVMCDLEAMGLLKSPHTSAGRIPTSRAYRVFVDSMLEIQPLEPSMVESLRLVLDPQMGEQQLVKAASSYLSGVTRMAGMVTVPRHDNKDIRQIEFLPLSERRVLAILIINDSEVQNRIIHVERDYSKDELETLAKYLNQEYLGRPLAEVRDRMHGELKRTRADMSRLMELMIDVAGKVFDEEATEVEQEQMVVAGETNLFAHADLNDVEKLRELFEAFHTKRDIYHLLERCLSADGVQIFIGRESDYGPLDDCSLVTAPYKAQGKVLGVLGVVGPKRMAYASVIPLVDVTSKLLSAALSSRH